MMGNNLFTTSTTAGNRESTTHDAISKLYKELADQTHSGPDLQTLDEKVKSMMGKGQKKIPNGGKQENGTPIQARSSICKLCGKKGCWMQIRNHIESNHLEGVSIPCDHCDKIFSSRNSLSQHKSKFHKWTHFDYISTYPADINTCNMAIKIFFSCTKIASQLIWLNVTSAVNPRFVLLYVTRQQCVCGRGRRCSE